MNIKSVTISLGLAIVLLLTGCDSSSDDNSSVIVVDENGNTSIDRCL
jgi:hypothetical protein